MNYNSHTNKWKKSAKGSGIDQNCDDYNRTKGKLPPHNEKLLPPCLDYTISFISDWAKSPAAFTRIRVAFPGIYAKGTSSNFRVIFYYASRD